MNKHTETIEKLMHSFNKINEQGKKPRDYGTGHLLFQAEIHAIQAVKNHSQVNASEIAKALGITNGAITQVIDKLVKKGLVDRYYLNNNRRDVYFKLTNEGEIAFQGHERYHEETNSEVLKYLDELEDDKINVINDFLDKFNEKSHD